MEPTQFLRQHIAELVSISDEEFERISGYFVTHEVAKKQFLISAGQRVDMEYLVVDGCLKTCAFDEDGKEYITQLATAGWWASDYPAYSTHTPAGLFVQALEHSWVMGLSKAHRDTMCDKIPVMYAFFARKSTAGYVAAQKRILSLLLNSASEKYELLLHQYPGLFQRLPQKTIAHYLGVSRETLSRFSKK